MLRENVQAQRMAEEQSATTPSQAIPQVPIPIISQGDDSPPAENTRQQHQVCTLTQDYLFHMMEIPGYQAPFTPAQAASRKYPLQFLCDFAYAVLDDDTGDLLEYPHLIKHPKYKDTWSQSFVNKIRCQATTTETIFFINKQEIPKQMQR